MTVCEGVQRSQAGFTLIEVLTALAIGSVIIMGTAALIHGVALNFDRGVRGVGDAERLVLAVERLAADFGSARFVPDLTGRPISVAFKGEAERVAFVGAAGVGRLRDERSSGSVEELVSLTVERQADARRLVRRRGAWLGPGTVFEDVVLQDSVVLLEGQFDAAFNYVGKTPEGALNWSSTWIGQPALPRIVRLTLRNSATGADLIPAAEFIVRSDGSHECSTANAGASCLSVLPKRRDESGSTLTEGGNRRERR